MNVCPNLGHPTYKEMKNRYGSHAQYVAATLFDSPQFQEWKGDDEIPRFENGNVLSNTGSTFSIDKYMENYLDGIKDLYNIRDVRYFNFDNVASRYYEAYISNDGVKVRFRREAPAPNYQKQWSNDHTNEAFVRDVVSRLQKKFGLKAEVINDMNKKWAGKFENGVPTINLAYATDDTPFHEFAHPFVHSIRFTNPALYANLQKELEKESDILTRTKSLYPELTGADLIEEAITQAIGQYANDDLKSPLLIHYIQEALKWISEQMNDLFHSKYLLPAELPAKMTLRHIAALMNSEFHIPVLSMEGLYQQKIDNAENQAKEATNEQKTTIETILSAAKQMIFVEEGHTYTDKNGISYTSTSDSNVNTFKNNGNDYSINATWGTQAHGILEDLINGVEVRDTLNLSDEARGTYTQYFKSLIADLTKDGTKLIAETVLSNAQSRVAGKADLILVHPDGSLSIYDVKTSINSTLEGKYDTEHTNAGLTRSKRLQNSIQLSVYKSLLESMGLKVNSLVVVPTHIAENTDTQAIKIDIEPLIPLVPQTDYVKTLLDNRAKNIQRGSKGQKDYNHFLNKLRIVLQEKISKIQKSLVSKSGASALRLKELKDLQDSLIGVDAISEISRVVDTIHIELITGKDKKQSYSDSFDSLIKNTEAVLAQGDPKGIQDAIRKLNMYFNYVKDYEGLEEYRQLYSDSVKSKIQIEPGSPLAKLNEIIIVRDEMEAAYQQAVKPLYAAILKNEINPEANKAAQRFLESKMKYQRMAKTARDQGYENRAKEFEKKYADAEAQFKKMYVTEASILENLTATSGDLGMLEFLTGNLSGSSDSIMGLFAMKIKAAFARVDEFMFKFQNEAATEFNKFAKATGRNQNDVEAFNKGLYEEVTKFEKNSEGTYIAYKEKHFVSPIDQNKYNASINQMFMRADKISTDRKNEARVKFIQEWFSINHIARPQEEIDDILLKKQLEFNDGYITKLELDNWYKRNVKVWQGKTTYIRDLTIPNPAIYSSQAYKDIQKNPDMKRYYDFLINSYLKSQEQYPAASRMGYKLPSIPKQLEDKVREKGGWKKVLPDFKDAFLASERDYEKYGNSNKVIPTYYTQKMNADEVSNDLIGSITRFAQAATQYEAIAGSTDKVGLETEATALLNILKNRDIEALDSKSQKVVKDAAKKLGLTDAQIDKKGGLFAAFFEHFIDQNLYGVSEAKHQVEIPEFRIPGTNKVIGGGKVDTGKLANTFMGLASWPALGGPFTILKAIANKLNAEANTYIEGHANQYISKQGLFRGKTTYNKWIVNNMAKDYNSAVPQSIEGQLMEYFSPIQGEFRDKVGKDLSWNAFKRAFQPGSWFFLQKAGEHSTQMSMFFGMMHEKMVKQGDQQIKLIDAFELDEHGHLKMKDGVEFSSKDKDLFVNRIHAINKSLHGIYNKMDKSVAQKQAIGRLAMMYRKFLVPAVKRRWGEIQVNQELGDTVEGFHRTLMRTIRHDFQDLLNHYMGRSNNLTPMEQANIRRATMELALIATLSTMIFIMSGLKEHDDQLRKGKGIKGWVFNSALYEAMRLNSEFKFFLPAIGLGDQLRIFTSPSAANSTLQKLYHFGVQLTTGPLETYDKNSKWHKAGDSKLGAAGLSLLGVGSIDPIRDLEQFSKLY